MTINIIAADDTENSMVYKYYCPCCYEHFEEFKSFVVDKTLYNETLYINMPLDILCPNCYSLPRHRIICDYLENNKPSPSGDILLFSPTEAIKTWFLNNGITYTSSDLSDNTADIKADIQRLPFEDEMFDFISCDHVLEHVDDYTLALKELHRIVKVGGCVEITVPIFPYLSSTYEDNSFVDSADRIAAFGQHDHLRIFGNDFIKMLRDAGFDVAIYDGDDCDSRTLPIVAPAIYDYNKVFLCKKIALSQSKYLPLSDFNCVTNSEGNVLEKARQPKVSIIIPCYNAEPFLRQCLDSVVGQTLRDIEIICVDDGSEDGTLDIIQRYSSEDSRVKYISFNENASLAQARKAGVAEATGNYIMFVDADDYLQAIACEVVVNIADESGVDIVQFGANVINCSNLTKQMIANARKFTTPYNGILTAENLVDVCYGEINFNYNLWGKLYRAAICKQAYSEVEDGRFQMAEDLYAFFLIAYFSKSYTGKNYQFYNYCYGRGMTGHIHMGISRFELLCTGAAVTPAIIRFLVKEDKLENYKNSVDNIEMRLLNDCLSQWENALDSSDMAQGFDIMVEHWGKKLVILELAKKYWDECSTISKPLLGASALKPAKDKIKTIATYYHRAGNGGAEKVNAKLITLWTSMGFNVVLLTDNPPDDDDYTLPNTAVRLVLPDYRTHTSNMYEERYTALVKIVSEYDVDVFIYHAWISESAFWDMLTVKSSGCRIVMHCHGVFTIPLLYNSAYFSEMPYVYMHFDAVLTLSKADTVYWQNINASTYQMFNPLTFNLQDVELSPLNSLNVLWLARLSAEKNPMHAVHVIELVMREIPDVILHIVGKGDPHFTQIEQYIESTGLQDNIILHGFTLEVEKHYKNASIFLMTSNYEGLPLTLLESKSYGVPCVCYEMPYLDLCQDGRGIVSVPHGNIKAAAKEIVCLLRDSELRRQFGADARASIEDYAKTDIREKWQRLFDCLVSENGATTTVEIDSGVFAVVMRTIRLHSVFLRKYQKDSASTMQRQQNELISMNKRLAEISQSYTLRAEVNKKRVEAYDNKLETYRQRIETYQQRIETYKVKAASQKNKIAEYKSKQETYKEKISEQKTKLDTYTQRVADLKAREETYKQKIAAHKTKEAAYIKHKKKLDDIYRSRSWKLARILSAPVRVMRRIVSRG